MPSGWPPKQLMLSVRPILQTPALHAIPSACPYIQRRWKLPNEVGCFPRANERRSSVGWLRAARLYAEEVEVAGAGALAGPHGISAPDGLQADEAHDRAALARQQVLPDPPQALVAHRVDLPSACDRAPRPESILHDDDFAGCCPYDKRPRAPYAAIAQLRMLPPCMNPAQLHLAIQALVSTQLRYSRSAIQQQCLASADEDTTVPSRPGAHHDTLRCSLEAQPLPADRPPLQPQQRRRHCCRPGPPPASAHGPIVAGPAAWRPHCPSTQVTGRGVASDAASSGALL